MKYSLIFCFLAALGVFEICMVSCTAVTDSSYQELPLSPTPHETKLIRLRNQHDEFQKKVSELSQEYGFEELRSKKLLSNEIEIRVWSSIGHDYDNVFILNMKDESGRSLGVMPVVNATLESNKKPTPKMQVVDLGNPKSGWSSLRA